MKNITSWIGYIIAGYMVLDVAGLGFWILSGQYPIEGNYYIGTVTAHLLAIII